MSGVPVVTKVERFSSGFTLIEFSIVLVIIGLIVGGVLVGRDLIAASQVRSTVAQIEKFQVAANTFRGKYEMLPGDINSVLSSRFGLAARGSNAGEGDGNGIIEGIYDSAPGSSCGYCPVYGETSMFWRDLGASRLVDGSFNYATATLGSVTLTTTSTPGIKDYFPAAKLGGGNYFYVWSGGIAVGSHANIGNGKNYFGISGVYDNTGVQIQSNTSLLVSQAYTIDLKIDDGKPQSGRVLAAYVSATSQWAGNSTPWSLSGNSGTCYDNNGAVDGTPYNYSISQNNGSGANCGLSIAFQ